MERKELDISSESDIDFITNLYIESFPLSERRPIDKMMALYKNNPLFKIDTLRHNNELVGFLSYWLLGDFIYAEHFAISPESRNKNYGQKAMEMLMESTTLPIVLEVELPSTILSERRIGFYQRLGFKFWDNIPYLQPSYHNDGNTIPMKLMTFRNLDLDKDLSEIRDRIYREVYYAN